MYKAIMLPIDLAHESSWKKAIPVALKMAEAFGAKLHVITVVQDIRDGMVAQYFPDDFETKMVREAAETLSGVVAREMPGVDVTEHVAAGQIYREIVRAAEKNGCDLIVMASHRPELADLLIGPNADHVARHTPASVMIVRE
ncbi:universal stress protein [Oricola sp.]|uniref:universal stress protein n=1 Tax=Oricola sp. TaxID=1979950 RepID=UPI000C99210F|nr:universal stress protein UspA [Ahrensia sp.]|tara:strand:- start:101277 stop:101702 length:426 start_codon:yes stop_codon:yes gene_type:complete